MNFLLFVILLGGVVANSIPCGAALRGPSDSLRNTLENIKKQMPCGFPEYNIPPLAPFKQEKIEFDIDEEMGQASGELNNLRIDGLNEYDIDDIQFSLLTLKITFNFNFKKISALSQYISKVTRPITLNSKGDLDFKLTDLRLKGTVKLGAKLSGVQVKDFNIVVTLGGAESNISGIVDDEKTNEFLNNLIEKMVVDIVREQQTVISKKIYDIVVPEANKILSQYTLGEIISMISKPSKPSTCVPPPDNDLSYILY